MNAIPLINNNVMRQNPYGNETQLRQEINTSLVALKKEAGTLEGLINEAAQMLVTINNRIATLENDTVKKSDIVDVIQSGNMNPVTSNAVADKISSLDVSSVGGSGKYISAISETDGKINATATDLATSVASGNNAPVTSNAVYTTVENIYNTRPRTIIKNEVKTITSTTWNGICFVWASAGKYLAEIYKDKNVPANIQINNNGTYINVLTIGTDNLRYAIINVPLYTTVNVAINATSGVTYDVTLKLTALS